MAPKNKVFIATSLDGFIACKNGEIDFLDSYPDPNPTDMGYENFMSDIDAMVMGRNTFDTVCGFDIEWPYKVPVFVLSERMSAIPDKFQDKAELVKGDLSGILNQIHAKGFQNLYIDGGKTIQHFLQHDLIDEMTITIIPCLLGEGIPLFSSLQQRLDFTCADTRLFASGIVQNRFLRKR